MPARTPASWLDIPKHFGRRPDVTFRAGETLADRAEARAASAQHEAALAARDALDRSGQRLEDLARLLDVNADHLRRKLSGQVPASLTDLLSWCEALGLDARPVAQAVLT